MKNKKIVFLINSISDGGAEKLVVTLVEKLYNDGYAVELLCLEKDIKYTLSDDIKVTYLTHSTSRMSGVKKLLFLPIYAYKLYKYVKENNVSVVQSHLFRANYVNILSKVIFRSKQTMQVVNHSVISRYKNQGIIGKVNLALIKYLYPSSDAILSVSNVVQNDMQKLFNFKNDSKVIYNMFDMAKIKSLSNQVVNDFKFREDKKYLISVGRLIKLKRNKDLILALEKLNSDIEILFIGDGEEKEALQNKSRELKVLDRVHFLGWVQNPYSYINKSDILLSTSQTESFGNVLVEAMVCKIPVISTRSGGPKEIIENGVNGVLINIGDIENLVENINLILYNEDVKMSYIQNGYMKIKKFDIENIIKEYKDVLGV